MLSKPAAFAMSIASYTCAAVCLRPMERSISSLSVWGLMLILPTPQRLMAANFSGVTVSGLPASTVNSLISLMSKYAVVAVRTLSNCSAESVVGVPPPM